MRTFFAGLLLLNIAFATWYWFLYEPVTVELPRADAGVEVLLLATEQQQDEQADNTTTNAGQNVEQQSADTRATTREKAVEETAVAIAPAVQQEDTAQQNKQRPPVKTGQRRCYVMGMFERKQAAENRVREMQALGYQVKLVPRYPESVRFLVYLPAYPSYNDARKVTQDLQRRGKSDFQILSINGEKNSISLGVYSQERTAGVRRSEIAGLGYEPRIQPVYGKALGFDIEFSKGDGSDLTDSEQDFLLISEKKVTIQTVKCGS